jgi:short-subunit dehydrogenase
MLHMLGKIHFTLDFCSFLIYISIIRFNHLIKLYVLITQFKQLRRKRMSESTMMLNVEPHGGLPEIKPLSQPGAKQPFCLVTGASRGLGRALAEEGARSGMNLILVDLPDTSLAEVADTIAQKYSVTALYRESDLTVPNSPEELCSWVQQEQLSVNMLINNAGLGAHGPFSDSSPNRNLAMISLNITALVQLTHLFLPELRKHDNAYILNVASLAAFYAMPFKPVYAPSKAFVLNFSLALRTELAGTTVGISTLCPGGIITNEACRKLIAAQGFIGRISCHHPEEVARYALRQLLRNKPIIVPGLINKVARFLAAVVPLPLVHLFIRSRFGTTAGGKEQSTPASLPYPHKLNLLELRHE